MGGLSTPHNTGNDERRTGRLGLAGEHLVRRPRLAHHIRPTRENQVVSPSRMIALGDSVKLYPELAIGITTPTGSIQENLGRPFSLHTRRHRNQWNTVFCDGHVELWKPKKLFNDKDNEIRRLWNNDNEPHPEFREPTIR